MTDTGSTTTYRQQLRKRIIATSMTEFATKGVKAVKMDDIAQKLGISKRTLYELYENKEQLLHEGVMAHYEERERQLNELMERKLSVMDIILHIYKNAINDVKDITPVFFSDIVKYPAVLEFIEQSRERNQQRMQDLLRQGTEEGAFIKGVNHELTSTLFNAMSDIIMQQKLYQKYSMKEVFQSIVFTSLRGICTQQGVSMLDELNI
ncbi:MAG: TetR/AcrR family transcriptional regulator [Prevotella sp.]|nr:TetR/AcrR family transcriptional regulator [Prevotella sp.]